MVARTVVIDRSAGFLRWSRAFYPQDGDGLLPSSTLTFKLTRNAKTTLRLYDARGTLVRTVWTARALRTGDHRWAWNGRLANGAFAAQGRYEARLTVASTLGSVVLVRPVWASAFAVTPSATTVKPGQVLRIAFTSIEPLATKPVVTFKQPGKPRGLRDRHAPHRRQLRRVVQGAGRGARDRDGPDRREGRRRRRQPDVGLDPGRVVSAVSARTHARAP